MQIIDKLSVAEDVVSREIGGETVLLNLTSGTYFGLDGVGARIWQIIENNGGCTIRFICDVLCGEFDVSRDTLQRDVIDFGVNLVEQGLLMCESQ